MCDILAGATSEFAQRRSSSAEDSDYLQALQDAGITELIRDGMWPSADVTPEALGRKGWDGSEFDRLDFRTDGKTQYSAATRYQLNPSDAFGVARNCRSRRKADVAGRGLGRPQLDGKQPLIGRQGGPETAQCRRPSLPPSHKRGRRRGRLIRASAQEQKPLAAGCP